jgi:hypothetical protein
MTYDRAAVQNVKTAAEAYTAFYSTGIGVISWGQRGRGMMSTTNFQLVSRLSRNAVIILHRFIGFQGLVIESFTILSQ